MAEHVHVVPLLGSWMHLRELDNGTGISSNLLHGDACNRGTHAVCEVRSK